MIGQIIAGSILGACALAFLVALFPTYETSLWFKWRHRCHHLDGWLNECVHYQHCVRCGIRRPRSDR